jgi:2'-5' RNA ligase
MEQIRSFIAIELSEQLKLEITRLQEQLRSGSQAPVKWVDAKSIHLTLKFLGNISTGITGKITSAMEEAVQGIHPFHLEVMGLTGDVDRLNQLQQRIDAGLVALGFDRESRPFTPHLTLARLRDRATPEERNNLGQLVASTSFETRCSLEVDSVQLMRSQLTREGAIYSRICSIMLK